MVKLRDVVLAKKRRRTVRAYKSHSRNPQNFYCTRVKAHSRTLGRSKKRARPLREDEGSTAPALPLVKGAISKRIRKAITHIKPRWSKRQGEHDLARRIRGSA